MSPTSRTLVEPQETGASTWIKQAAVLRRTLDRVLVRLDPPTGAEEAWAIPAMGDQPAPEVGRRVVVMGGGAGECFVVGVLPSAAPADAAVLAARSGATTRIVDRDGAERIQVSDARDQILFDYDPATGRGVLTMPEGDLALRAPSGNIDLEAGKGIRCHARDAITVASARGVQLGVRQSGGRVSSELTLESGRAALASSELDVAAEKGTFFVNEGVCRGSSLAVTCQRIRVVVEKMETVVSRLIERAQDTYRYVANLSQLKAGRSRTVVDDSYQLQAGRAVIKAKEDVKVCGERIHLG